MKTLMAKLEHILELGGTKKDIALLSISGIALLLSLFRVPLPLNPAWFPFCLWAIPIILEALMGLITAFKIRAEF